MRKFIKLFFLYSYVTLVCYVGSENFLDIAKYYNKKKKGELKNKEKLVLESMWRTTLKRFKEGMELGA